MTFLLAVRRDQNSGEFQSKMHQIRTVQKTRTKLKTAEGTEAGPEADEIDKTIILFGTLNP